MKSIIYIQYTNPAGYPPLEHSSRILAEAGWQVRFLGTGAHGAEQLRFPPHPRIAVSLLRFQPPGWRQKLHFFVFVLWCVGWCLFRRPTVVYCSDLLSTPIGLTLRFLFRIPVVYHEHDTPGPPSNRFLRTVGAARRRLATEAVVCVIPNHARRQRFDDELRPRRSTCVWNCPTRDEVLPPRADQVNDALTLWYHGSLNPGQFPPTVIDAVAQLPPTVWLRFAGYETIGHLGYVRNLRERAERLGVSGRVEYVGTPGTRAELYAAASTADVGLTLFARKFREPMAGASNKPFDYLACGLALLVTNTEEWANLYDACGWVADPSDPDSIAAAVRSWLSAAGAARGMGETGRRRVLAEWNYETQFEPLKRILEKL